VSSFDAAGKVILLGEHAVVYGHPALAGALAHGVAITTSPGRGLLRVAQWDLLIDPERAPSSTLAQAYAAIRRHAAPPTVDLDVCFHFPTGAGLGSSAALAVAVGRALGLDGATLEQAAMDSETVIHGRPSGLDHTVSIAGSFGLFTRADGLRPLHAPPLPLVIGHTGRARDTKGRVARVAELLAERSDEVRDRFGAIAGLVARGARAVVDGALGELGEAMNENQRHLEALEVSCPEIERLCAIARDAGAVGAKLTGGGGGGCVIAVAPGREGAVADAWRAAGFAAFDATVSA
jgi:mevalonate kinase